MKNRGLKNIIKLNCFYFLTEPQQRTTMTEAMERIIAQNSIIQNMKQAFVLYKDGSNRHEQDRKILKTVRNYCKMSYETIKPHLDEGIPCLNLKYECAVYGHIYNKDYDKAVKSFDKLKDAYAKSKTAYHDNGESLSSISDKVKDFYMSSKLEEFQVLMNYIKP